MALLCIYSDNNKKHESEKSDWKMMANFSFTLCVLISTISDMALTQSVYDIN